MQYADVDGERLESFKGGRGLCPVCRTKVIAKAGSLKVPHWAHESLTDCDRFSEPETAWHRAWKSLFPPECREVVVGRNRADVMTRGDIGEIVLEFQNSPISREKILDRQRAYGDRLIWIINGNTLAKHAEFTPVYWNGDFFGRKALHYSLWWKWGSGLWAGQRAYIQYSNRLGSKLFRLEPNTLKRDWAGSLVGKNIHVWELRTFIPIFGGGFNHGAFGWAEDLENQLKAEAEYAEYCKLNPSAF